MSGFSAIPARPFGAVGTAMVTPMTADASALDLDAARTLAVHLVEQGNDLLVLGGTTGESPTVTDQEKIDLVREVRDAVGPEVTILSGVGSNDTRHSIDLARAHADLEIDGIMIVTPYYSRPSQEGIIAHTLAVTEASDKPVMLYDIPGRSAAALSTETLLRLGEHERIVAVKDAKGDLNQATQVMQRSGLAYYSGEDALNLAWLSIGAAGIVSVVAHAAPFLSAALVRSVDAGDLPAARSASAALAPLTEAMMTRAPGVVTAKTALMLQGVLPHAAVRLPLVPLSTDEVSDLAAALDAAEGNPPLTLPA